MLNPSLRDLPGVSPSYVGFLEGVPAPGQTMPDRPEKGLLLSRCRFALSRMPPWAGVSEAVGKETPIVAGSPLWAENIKRLKSCSAVVVGASADAADFGTSLVALLKCLTVIKLTDEISHEGVPAVPLLWFGARVQTQDSSEEHDSRIESPLVVRQQGGSSRNNLTDYFNGPHEPPLNKGVDSDQDRNVLTRLVREFGLVLVDSASIRSMLSRTPELEASWRRAISLCEQGSEWRAAHDEPGRDPVVPGQVADEVLLRLSLPVAAEVVGPEDYDTAVLVGNLVGSAGNVKPFLWPRVSATIVDRRSCRTMEKFKLELPDLLQGIEALSGRLGIDHTGSDVSSRLEALAGIIRRRIDEICARAARDGRAVRRIQTSGSKIFYQLGKLAVRSRQFADAHHDIAVRQFEELRGRVAPGGELQEGRLSALEFLSVRPGSILQELYRRIDVWDLKHQLIIGLD